MKPGTANPARREIDRSAKPTFHWERRKKQAGN